MQVEKRNGTIQPWDGTKVIRAVKLAASRTNESVNPSDVLDVVLSTYKNIDVVKVDDVHTTVENTLMDMKAHNTAREYITYRYSHKPDIFQPSKAILNYDYPQLLEYKTAIQHSYWLFSEYNYTSDVNDILVRMTEHERESVLRAVLAICQIEVKVKKFWGNLGNHIQAQEVWEIGACFGESELRHKDFYANILVLLGLQDRFNHIASIPVLKKRSDYLSATINAGASKEDTILNVLLFSIFVENISLFSQFMMLKAFNQFKQMLKGLDNGLTASTKEEALHANFGFELINIIKKENPRLWTSELEQKVIHASEYALQTELELVDWITGGEDFSFLTVSQIKAFITKRMYDSLNTIGVTTSVIPPDTTATRWFEEEILLPSSVDFFNKRSTGYTKKSKAFNEEDLF